MGSFQFSFVMHLPLHGWSANTAVEGKNNAMNYDNNRTHLPLIAWPFSLIVVLAVFTRRAILRLQRRAVVNKQERGR